MSKYQHFLDIDKFQNLKTMDEIISRNNTIFMNPEVYNFMFQCNDPFLKEPGQYFVILYSVIITIVSACLIRWVNKKIESVKNPDIN